MKLEVRFDGSHTPYRTGYGWVIVSDGRVVGSGSGVVAAGVKTCNVAEYHGLIAGLEAVLALPGRPRFVRLVGDSRLVVMQVKRKWKCNHAHLRELRNRARVLIGRLGCSWGIAWRPRDQNGEADALSRGDAVPEPSPAENRLAEPVAAAVGHVPAAGLTPAAVEEVLRQFHAGRGGRATTPGPMAWLTEADHCPLG